VEQIVVAFVRRAHGLKGEFQLHMRTDEPESVFEAGLEFTVAAAPQGLPDRLTLEWAKPHGRAWRAKFAEIGDRTIAERYTGRELTLPRDELRDLDADEFFVHELIGFAVLLVDGTPVGDVDDFYDASGTVLLGVVSEGRERLVPFTGDVVSKVDVDERRIVIDPPDGLLEI